MKKLFKHIGNWFHDNYKYDGFVQMILWGSITLIILMCNICTLSNDRIDWFLFALELIFTLWMAERWQNGKRLNEYKGNVKWAVDQAYDMAKTTATQLDTEHARLIAANRRRKRAERKLKWCVKTLRKESAERLGFEIQCDVYESVLLDANLAMADISSCPILPDTKAMAEAQQRFKSYMKIHYAEIANRQLHRELKESAFGCLFFGDTKHKVKETYAGLFGSKEFCQQLFADAAKDANVCLGALLGIKEEESPSTEIKENQQQ